MMQTGHPLSVVQSQTPNRKKIQMNNKEIIKINPPRIYYEGYIIKKLVSPVFSYLLTEQCVASLSPVYLEGTTGSYTRFDM